MKLEQNEKIKQLEGKLRRQTALAVILGLLCVMLAYSSSQRISLLEQENARLSDNFAYVSDSYNRLYKLDITYKELLQDPNVTMRVFVPVYSIDKKDYDVYDCTQATCYSNDSTDMNSCTYNMLTDCFIYG